MLIDLGGGTLPHPRADYVIDLHHPKNTPAQDATNTPWHASLGKGAIPDSSVDEIYASHFMEHIPRGQPLVDVMNEAWRVLKPGGTFLMIMPLVGYTDHGVGKMVAGWQPYADPTHVNYWWLPEALLYFCYGQFAPHADYGLRMWTSLGDRRSEEDLTDLVLRHQFEQQPAQTFWGVRGGWEGVAQLVKPQ
jgi:SAM-dependent methyltransferase